ncbi:winged helix-turn-helix domain-containing protein [Colwellia psychrerythraea]|uniref:Transcriptional regulator, CadC n=1 Tax=Colwellia psychrerythraea TaxID=28229 RepID=A0A099KKQ7_COLPS|nr:winged helix-turn-helix domain-containing protein [Colwellia psychrerythraea]KGJ90860.1 transcriptional regulator, CadC [Colwellia psychrerythraea]
MRFTFNDIELNLTAGLLIKDGQTISIRAKTLLVLKYLIAEKDHVVTKQALLAEVWHDVVVQEQVLVQSIKEIRDLLGSHVIKTYPRQGYQWTAELSEITNERSIFGRSVNTSYLALITALILLTFIGLFIYQTSQSNHQSSSKERFTVALLPVINDMPDDIHDWVPLQGMDYISQSLTKNTQLQLIPRTQLLQSIPLSKQTKLQNSVNPDPQELRALTQTLNVDLLVQTTLRGYPQDFQLDYSFYLARRVEQGVILSSNIRDAFTQLVQRITQRFAPDTAQISQPYISDFSNEAFARGIALYLQRDYVQATTFFSSALQTNNDLLAARRFLAASYINSGDTEQGIILMKENIAQARQKKMPREEIRSHLMIGVLLIHQYEKDSLTHHDLSKAERYILLTKKLAEQYHDALFIAYAHEELAKIKRLQLQYHEAIPLLKKAIQYHKEFKGSYGQTRALIELALIAYAQGKTELGGNYFTQATTIAYKDGVATNKVAILLAQAQVALNAKQIEAAQNYAKHAKNIAIEAKNNILIARVTAWQDDSNTYQVN